MEVSATTQPASATDADTIVLGVFDGDQDEAQGPAEVSELLASGEARGSFKSLALAHADGQALAAVVGLGARERVHARARACAAAVARDRARELSAEALCWELPAQAGAEVAAALVEGTILADYRFERHKSAPATEADARPKSLGALIVSSRRGPRATRSPRRRSSPRRSTPRATCRTGPATT